MTAIYATQVTSYYLAAVAAFEAGGAALNIAGGTLHVGDGNGSVPAISALIAANDVTHQVWSGSAITGVFVDSGNPDQLDIACDIPASIGGVEIGPFTVTEFAIFDAAGHCCIVGTTNLQKTVASMGMTTDLAFIAAVVYGVAGSVTVTPPGAGYVTLSQLITFWNTNLPTVVYPLLETDTTSGGGVDERVFSIAPALQATDPVTSTNSPASMGSGRPASAAEFAAGAASGAGVFAWPWPTLQQIAAMKAALTTKHLHVQKQRDVSTSPPALTNIYAAWTLNTVLLNEISGASLNTSSGQITLPAGKYHARFAGMASGAGRHLCRLRNVTASATLGFGLVADSYPGDGVTSTTNVSLGEAVFTLSGNTVLQLEHADLNAYTGFMGDQTVGLGGTDYDAYVMIATC